MTQQQYDNFKQTVEANGYKLCNHAKTISNENFYYYKGFAYTEDENGKRSSGYQVLFLVWDFRMYEHVPENYEWGVTPMVLTDSHDWSRIDLMITEQNFDVEKVEHYAHDFYFNFVLVHGV